MCGGEFRRRIQVMAQRTWRRAHRAEVLPRGEVVPRGKLTTKGTRRGVVMAKRGYHWQKSKMFWIAQNYYAPSYRLFAERLRPRQHYQRRQKP